MKAHENQLAEQFMRNEHEAFRKLFQLYYKPMCVAAKLYMVDSEDAEDIVQQVFIKFWEEKHFNKIKTSYKSFLHSSVRNACLNHLKKQTTNKLKQDTLTDESRVDQAIDFMLRKEEKLVFEHAYAELPPQSRKALELVYFSNQPYKTAAKTMNISVNTVKSHLQNALRILKNSSIINSYFIENKNG
jgi:RNA polymerase sigma-70 factor, ECF subfamily